MITSYSREARQARLREEEEIAWSEFLDFAGPRGRDFRQAWDARGANPAPWWPGAVAFAPWLIYRRMTAHGLVVGVLLFALGYVAATGGMAGKLGAAATLGALSAFCALYGKRLYVGHARAVMETARLISRDEAECAARVRQAGGVSAAAAAAFMLGVALVALSLTVLRPPDEEFALRMSPSVGQINRAAGM